MESGASTNRSCALAAFVAGTATLSCGPGVHDGRGEVFTSQTIDQRGGQLVLREGTLDVWQECLSGPVTITLRRYDSIDHRGAVGPVFEIQVPTPDTFRKDPRIGIAASSLVAGSASSVIGFLVPGVASEQWVPDSSVTISDCLPGVVCGPVQRLSFINPGGSIDPSLTTTLLRLAIVTRCTSNEDCASQQACNSGACQQCPTSSLCNP